MQQQPLQNSPTNEFVMMLNTMSRQLERLDERTRDLATRADLEALRKELVGKESLEPMLSSLKAQISRVDADRIDDKQALEKRLDKIEAEPLSRQDRLWMRLSQAMSVAAFALALYEFLIHLRITP